MRTQGSLSINGWIKNAWWHPNPSDTLAPDLSSPTPDPPFRWPSANASEEHELMGPGLRDRNAGEGSLLGVLTGSGGTAPQHSAARLSSTSNIAGPPPATARGPDRLRAARSYSGARGHTSGLRLPQHCPGRGGPLAPSHGGECSARPAGVARAGCRGPSVSRAATHAPAQRTGECGEPGARVRARPARPSLQARLAAGGRLGPRRPRCPSWPRGAPALPVKV